jgi:hypothetical protein
MLGSKSDRNTGFRGSGFPWFSLIHLSVYWDNTSSGPRPFLVTSSPINASPITLPFTLHNPRYWMRRKIKKKQQYCRNGWQYNESVLINTAEETGIDNIFFFFFFFKKNTRGLNYIFLVWNAHNFQMIFKINLKVSWQQVQRLFIQHTSSVTASMWTLVFYFLSLTMLYWIQVR